MRRWQLFFDTASANANAPGLDAEIKQLSKQAGAVQRGRAVLMGGRLALDQAPKIYRCLDSEEAKLRVKYGASYSGPGGRTVHGKQEPLDGFTNP